MVEKKLTFDEIIDILTANVPLHLFAEHEVWDDEEEDSFQFPTEIEEHPEYLAHKQKEDELRRALNNHPAMQLSYSEREKNESFIKVRDEYRSHPNSNICKIQLYYKYLGLGEVVEIEQKGGTDQGSEWYITHHFVNHDVYIKTFGYYSSYEGIEFYKGYGVEVFPIDRVVRFYEPKTEEK